MNKKVFTISGILLGLSLGVAASLYLFAMDEDQKKDLLKKLKKKKNNLEDFLDSLREDSELD